MHQIIALFSPSEHSPDTSLAHPARSGMSAFAFQPNRICPVKMLKRTLPQKVAPIGRQHPHARKDIYTMGSGPYPPRGGNVVPSIDGPCWLLLPTTDNLEDIGIRDASRTRHEARRGMPRSGAQQPPHVIKSDGILLSDPRQHPPIPRRQETRSLIPPFLPLLDALLSHISHSQGSFKTTRFYGNMRFRETINAHTPIGFRCAQNFLGPEARRQSPKRLLPPVASRLFIFSSLQVPGIDQSP